MVDPDNIHTREDLQQALRELYAGAKISYLRLAAHEDVVVSGTTIHGWVNGDTFPQWPNLSPVLRAWGVAADEIGAWKNAHTRADADARVRPGLLLNELLDPFALDVHESIVAPAADTDAVLDMLPPYVCRAHDDQLEKVVDRALAGCSGIVVLLGDSSTGKTRALWEALGPLRARRGWKLWYPSRYRPDELIGQLDNVGPRTVVWFNETQRYLLPYSELDRGRLIEKMHQVLANPHKAPVLVLGSLWRDHYATLCADPGSATRGLLEPAAIPVPESFTGSDLEKMRDAARKDSRLAMAVEKAENGKITQYLAGGPELIHFYDKQASVAGRAVIDAAMDLVRMGHPNVLPFTLLRDIAASYVDDITWDALNDDNWFEVAVSEISRTCKGARGPVTPIRARPLASRNRRVRRHSQYSEQPVYQLADYLDQHGRRTRAESTPPPAFWTAVSVHAISDHQNTIATAAWSRGLYREAVQLWKNATRLGHLNAAQSLVKLLSMLLPDDLRAADWAATHVLPNDPRAIATLINLLREVGAHNQIQILADRTAEQLPLNNLTGLDSLIWLLWRVGAHTQVIALADRIASQLVLNSTFDVALLIEAFHEVGEHIPMLTLADRAAAHVPLDSPGDLFFLIDTLWFVGAHTQIQMLADRAANHSYTRQIIDAFRKVSADNPRKPLGSTTAPRTTPDKPLKMAERTESLQHLREHSEMPTLLPGDLATHVTLDDAAAVALLIRELRAVDENAQIETVLQRDPAANVTLDNPFGAAELFTQLHSVNAHNQAQALATRLCAAGRFPILLAASPDLKEKFRFGRELDERLIPAKPWSWTDLE